ncbi:MAG: DUF2269 family protein [Actinobacteria bacterium]|nr:DUF2269 family protein [Actinomycetota bacterium]
MSLNDWILALHLLAAFALVGAQVAFTSMMVALWRTDDPQRVVAFKRPSQVAQVMIMAGVAGTLIFGIWLAISLEAYQLWDGWVIAAFVLWAIASGLGQQMGEAYGSSATEAERLVAAGTRSSPELAATYGPSRAFQFHVASVVVTFLLLLDMIWKPGA